MIDTQYKREEYRMKCKYYGCGDICLKESGFYGGLRFKNQETGKCGYSGMHFTIACHGDCRRMKNYDKKHANNE